MPFLMHLLRRSHCLVGESKEDNVFSASFDRTRISSLRPAPNSIRLAISSADFSALGRVPKKTKACFLILIVSNARLTTGLSVTRVILLFFINLTKTVNFLIFSVNKGYL